MTVTLLWQIDAVHRVARNATCGVYGDTNVAKRCDVETISFATSNPSERTMSIEVICDPTATMHHIAHVRNYIFPTDISTAEGGSDTGSDPHDLCDSAHAFS
jgi:hypothetical protein